MDTLRELAINLKNRIILTKLERQVAEVCTNENWSAQNSQLREIAERTFDIEDRQTIMKMVWESLKSPLNEWRRVHKALCLIEHLVKFGSNACVSEIRENTFKVRMLSDFSYREDSVERGARVRDKAKYVAALLSDYQLLEQEKEQAKRDLNKYVGIGSEDFKYVNAHYHRQEPPYSAREYKDPQEQRLYSEPTEGNVDIFSAPEVKQMAQQPTDKEWSGMSLKQMDIFGDAERANQAAAPTLSQPQFIPLSPTQLAAFTQHQPVRTHSNFSGSSSGPTISQLRYSPTMNTEYSSFRSAPPPQQLAEFKLFNLDNLRDGQPKQE